MNRRNFMALTLAGASTLTHRNAIGAASAKRIKIGQIGVTHEHAGVRMKALQRLSHLYELVGVVDDRASTVARYAGEDLKPYKGLPWLTEKELFEIQGLDAVIVETANGDLVPTALRCMEHGFAVSMDKPGGEDLLMFKQLLDGCKSKGLPFQMGYMFRANPAIRLVQQFAREGWLGEIIEIDASMSHNYGNERYQKYLSAYQGGIMFNLGCHHIDWVVSILGRPKGVRPVLTSTKSAKFGVKNLSLAILEYDHALVSIRANDSEVSGLQNRRIKVCGTNGTMEIVPIERFDGQPLELKLRLKDDAGPYKKGEHLLNLGVQMDRYELQLEEFAQMILGHHQTQYTYEHDYLVQEIHLAASGYLSWKA